jgi:hypothetical protein
MSGRRFELLLFDWLRPLGMARRHPPAQLLSQYLDGELAPRRFRALESHMRRCGRCRGLLESLGRTVEALGAMRADARPGLADRIIAAISLEPAGPRAPAGRAAAPTLALVTDGLAGGTPPAIQRSTFKRTPRGNMRAALRYCVSRRQLQLTLSLALLAGVALSLMNQGGMIFDGRSSALSICVSCAPNFLVPFLALNAVLLMASRLARGRPR